METPQVNARYRRQLVQAAWVVFAATACSGGKAADRTTPGAPGRPIAVTHVTVIDMTGAAPKPNMTVVATDGRLTAVGPSGSVSPPSAATVVDGTGKYLIPGLWDMHMHSTGDRYERSIVLPLEIANGVVGVRDMAGDCFGKCADNDSAYNPEHFPTIDVIHTWQRDIAAGTQVGPRMVVGSDMLDGPHPRWDGAIPIHDTAEARAAVRKEQDRGAAFIKVYDGLTHEEYLAIADEAKRRGIPFAGHVPIAVSLADAADAGQLSMEHLIRMQEACSSRSAEAAALAVRMRTYRPPTPAASRTEALQRQTLLNTSFSLEACAPLLQRFVRDHTWQVPTLTALRGTWYALDSAFTHDPRRAYMAAADTAWWQGLARRRAQVFRPGDLVLAKELFAHYEQIVGAMHRAGVGVLAGTDVSNPWLYWGFSLHDELANLVESGFTPMEALQAATIEPARFLGATDSLGTLERGKVADMVLLDADPLADIHNTQRISAVVVRGQLIDSAGRQRLLDGARVAAHTM
jgi:imidazolonepropionase-like amidohydrolase